MRAFCWGDAEKEETVRGALASVSRLELAVSPYSARVAQEQPGIDCTLVWGMRFVAMKPFRATVDELCRAMRSQLQTLIQETLEELGQAAGSILYVDRLEEFATKGPRTR